MQQAFNCPKDLFSRCLQSRRDDLFNTHLYGLLPIMTMGGMAGFGMWVFGFVRRFFFQLPAGAPIGLQFYNAA